MSSDCTLRSRFIGLLLLITLPTAGLLAYGLHQINIQARLDTTHQLDTNARLIASDLGLQLSFLQRSLRAASQRVDGDTRAVDCSALQRALGHATPLLAALRVSRHGRLTTCQRRRYTVNKHTSPVKIDSGLTLSVPLSTTAGTAQGTLQGLVSLPRLRQHLHLTLNDVRIRLLDHQGHILARLTSSTAAAKPVAGTALRATAPIAGSNWRVELITTAPLNPPRRPLVDTLFVGLLLLLTASVGIIFYGLRGARPRLSLPQLDNVTGALGQTLSDVDHLLGSSCRYSHVQNAVQERLRFLLRHDTLTGLPNREAFREQLIEAMAEADRQEGLVALLLLDLDRFKTVNDTLGHTVGDTLIEMVARRLDERCRQEGTISHLGGGEFGIVCPSAERIADVEQLAGALLETITLPFAVHGYQLHMTASIGIILYPLEEADYDQLISNAETAMFRAKRQGRNRYQFYTAEMNNRALQRLVLENSLRGALERDEFVLHYQPQFSLATGRLIGVEALLRWQHPEWGMVAPGEFITLLEETGMVVAVGRWVLHTACRQAAQWHRAHGQPLRVSVNLSVLQLHQRDLHHDITAILADTGLPAQSLELELTESVLMEEAESPVDTLATLRNTGVALAIDDFGTGYSSLSYLRRFPVDAIKIDRAFIKEIESDPHDSTIVGAIVQLAHSLDFRVVAEGVETPGQLQLLREHGCDEVQGFLLSRPVPAEAIEPLIKEEYREGVRA